ncbi:hypothetical protein LCGC14_0397070 [marine sediment metagenome]|uniref:Uncharacterized protein n=1 Tax=marine sediment metagenome TaxID=412755 RepID=A0A0F9T3J6_9ZZZZ
MIVCIDQTEQCSYCLRDYPYPVELHHSDGECVGGPCLDRQCPLWLDDFEHFHPVAAEAQEDNDA